MSDKGDSNQQTKQSKPQQQQQQQQYRSGSGSGGNGQRRHYYNSHQQSNYRSQQQYRQRQHQQQYDYNQDEQQQRNRYLNNSDRSKPSKEKDQALIADDTTSRSSGSYKHQISTVSTSSSTFDVFAYDSKSCVCCLHNLATYVTYICMHYVCLHCAIKMRILCEKFDCPICRQQSDYVICSDEALNAEGSKELDIEKRKSIFSTFLKTYEKIAPLKGGFYFKLDRIKFEYEELLGHKCKECKMNFELFEDLDQHTRRQHKLFYCELCVQYVKLFTFERKLYTTKQLATHRREGDPDDQSFKGHPNCAFCDQRFFDRDELYRHYRKDHYYCHFCDADGNEEYYENYPKLRAHFKTNHYLCELGECAYKEGANEHEIREYSAFRTEIDYNAHKKSKHAKNKSEAKSFGILNLEFNISNPIRDRIRERNERNNRQNNNSNEAINQQQQQQQQNLAAAAFPSLIVDESSSDSLKGKSVDASIKRKIENANKKLSSKQSTNLRDLYEKYEESQGTSKSVETMKPSVESTSKVSTVTPAVAATTSTIASSSIVAEESVEQPQSTAWRDLISTGKAPKTNLESEFPTLGDGPKIFSLSDLGESIAKQGNNSGVWSKKTNTKPSNNDNKEKNSKKVEKSKPLATVVTTTANTTSTTTDSASTSTISNRVISPLASKLNENVPEIDTKMVDLKKFLNKTKKTENLAGDDDDKAQEDDENDENKGKKGKKAKKNKKKKEMASYIENELNEMDGEIKVPTVPVSNLMVIPPPGFNKIVETVIAPPPVVLKNPPPGFATVSSSITNVDEFIKPQNYDKRNNELTTQLSQLLNESQFNSFKSISIEYRNSKVDARSYLDKCKQIFQNESNDKYKQFLDLLQEMIALLPNINLQNQLYDEYISLIQLYEQKQQQKQQSSQNGKLKLAWADKSQQTTNLINNRLVKCIKCNQFVINSELSVHMNIGHTIQQQQQKNSSNEAGSSLSEEFPPLSTASVHKSTFSDLPSFHTNSSNVIFNNPNESLSLVNKKKARYKKFLS